ncbi:L-2,4-diaminobutyrate decarboxylase [Methylophilaceae bacterium]|nr:L-2,4-diaminobutyrate decarboxylase [Methylophilaceae bacterium]
MNDREKLLNAMFDVQAFRSTGHELIDLLAEELHRNLAEQQPVLQWRNPAIEDRRWQNPLPQQSTLDLPGLLDRLRQDILPGNLGIHHPHNLGHQVATPLPVAALCDLVAALTNQAMAVYETGPSATMLERQVIRWLSALIGWQTREVNGVLTSGGAQANLTALLAARQHATASNIWKHGVSTQRPLRILASEYSHYSVSRAAGIMGLGTDAVIRIGTDEAGRMLMSEIASAHQRCLENQEIVMAVAANAACTPTGSIDPLQAIGEYCQAHQLWFHVDGAHGASALLSKQHRGMLQGIAMADSLVWDGHKLLYMPATVSAVLFRNAEHSYLAFAQDASYLFQGNDHDIETYNVSYRSLECTKRMMALKLWAAFSLYGVEGLAALVDEAFGKARLFAEKLRTRPDFELLMMPQTNIVCFRHLANGLSGDQLNRHQARLRTSLVESGEFHLTQVELHGKCWLRTTLMNPFTQEQHLDNLLDAIDRHSH